MEDLFFSEYIFITWEYEQHEKETWSIQMDNR